MYPQSPHSQVGLCSFSHSIRIFSTLILVDAESIIHNHSGLFVSSGLTEVSHLGSPSIQVNGLTTVQYPSECSSSSCEWKFPFADFQQKLTLSGRSSLLCTVQFSSCRPTIFRVNKFSLQLLPIEKAWYSSSNSPSINVTLSLILCRASPPPRRWIRGNPFGNSVFKTPYCVIR